MRPAFVSPVPGLTVVHDEQVYKIERIIGRNWVMAKNVETGELDKLRTELLREVMDENDAGLDGEEAQRQIELSDIPEEDWVVAQRRYAAIKPLLEMVDRSGDDVKRAAEEASVHFTTLYDWLRAYQGSYHLSSLIPMRPGPPEGGSRMPKATDLIIESAIEDRFLSKQKFKPCDVIEEVQLRCRQAGVIAPHPNTVRNRIKRLSPALVMRRRGDPNDARDRYDPIRGAFPGADFPLSVVQIDHTEADIILVDDHARLPLGRPWVTLAIDIHTRMVTGFYVSMERPSAMAAGMCVARSMLDKSTYLESLKVEGEWPVFGKIRSLHLDNAKEFKGHMLKRACEQYGIDTDFRPVKVPHYGGHIERYMGRLANECKKLSGATFSSPRERRGYNSDKMAALTLGEFEAYLADFIVNLYHKTVHSALGVSPLQKWKCSLFDDDQDSLVAPILLVNDPERLTRDFMPFENRTIQRYGVSLHGIHYFDEVLSPWINSTDPKSAKRKRTFTFRYDPRDLSHVHFFDPDLQKYWQIPYRNLSHPPVSIWEVRIARRDLRRDGRIQTDEDALFDTIARLRSRNEDAVRKTKSTRRQAQRVATARKVRKHGPVPTPAALDVPPITQTLEETSVARLAADDPFAGPVEIFEHDGDGQ